MEGRSRGYGRLLRAMQEGKDHEPIQACCEYLYLPVWGGLLGTGKT